MAPNAHSSEELPDPNEPVRDESARTAEPPPTDRPSRAEEQSSIDHRRERIRIETERHRIEGMLTLARDGYRSRVSDALNASERDFLTLTDVKVEPLEGGSVELHDYLTLARRHIVFAVSAEQPS